MPRGTHPNSLANLRPRPWKPGQSGNPAGRARGGAYISEWLNALLIVDGDGRPRYTKADLERIVADDDAAPAMVIAARRILSAMRDGKLPRGGADPEPGRDFDRIADRIEGKPPQAVHLTSEEQTTVRVVLLDRTASPTHKMVEELMRGELGADEPKQLEAG
ncbi:MAG: hypothetical protein IH830_13870 [Planctomycetes bacterium]|nr:hypothetical protein [Planctomycetota bacterium]